MRVDWDGVLGFSTYRTVKISDWRLGLLNYGLLAGTVFALFGYSVLFQCHHLSSTTLQTYPEVRGETPPTPSQKSFGFDIPGMDVQGGGEELKVPLKVSLIEQSRKNGSWHATGRPASGFFGDIGQFHLGLVNRIENNGAHYKTCMNSTTISEAFQVAFRHDSTSVPSTLMEGLSGSNLTRGDLTKLSQLRLNVRFRANNSRTWDFFGTEPMRCEVSYDVTDKTYPTFFSVIQPRYALENRQNAMIFAIHVRIFSDATLMSFSIPRLLTVLAGYSFLVTLVHTMVVLFASKVMPQRDEYSHLIYQTSRHFHQEKIGAELTEKGDGTKTSMKTSGSDEESGSSSSIEESAH